MGRQEKIMIMNHANEGNVDKSEKLEFLKKEISFYPKLSKRDQLLEC